MEHVGMTGVRLEARDLALLEGEEGEGGGWDVDDDLDIPEDIGDVGPATSEGEGYFVPPTKGSPPSQV